MIGKDEPGRHPIGVPIASAEIRQRREGDCVISTRRHSNTGSTTHCCVTWTASETPAPPDSRYWWPSDPNVAAHHIRLDARPLKKLPRRSESAGPKLPSTIPTSRSSNLNCLSEVTGEAQIRKRCQADPADRSHGSARPNRTNSSRSCRWWRTANQDRSRPSGQCRLPARSSHCFGSAPRSAQSPRIGFAATAVRRPADRSRSAPWWRHRDRGRQRFAEVALGHVERAQPEIERAKLVLHERKLRIVVEQPLERADRGFIVATFGGNPHIRHGGIVVESVAAPSARTVVAARPTQPCARATCVDDSKVRAMAPRKPSPEVKNVFAARNLQSTSADLRHPAAKKNHSRWAGASADGGSTQLTANGHNWPTAAVEWRVAGDDTRPKFMCADATEERRFGYIRDRRWRHSFELWHKGHVVLNSRARCRPSFSRGRLGRSVT